MAMSIESKLESAENSLANAREKAARFVSQPDSKEYKSACIRIKACKTRIQNLKALLAAAETVETVEAAELQELIIMTSNHNEALNTDLNNIIALKNDNEQFDLYIQRFSYLSDDFDAIDQAQTTAEKTTAEANAARKVIDSFKAEAERLCPSLSFALSIQSINSNDALTNFLCPKLDDLLKDFHQNEGTYKGLGYGILDKYAPLRESIYDDFIFSAKRLIKANNHIQKYVNCGLPYKYICTTRTMRELPTQEKNLNLLKFYLLIIETYEALMYLSAFCIYSTAALN